MYIAELNLYSANFGSSAVTNVIFSIGIISLAAERALQLSLSRKVTGVKYSASWICKGIQMGICAANNLHSMPRVIGWTLFQFCSSYLSNKMIEPSLFLWPVNSYKLAFSLVAGYWVDRTVKITEKPGPVRIIVSLALMALSFINIRYDMNHLHQQALLVEDRS
jgi:hypothetical protein